MKWFKKPMISNLEHLLNNVEKYTEKESLALE